MKRINYRGKEITAQRERVYASNRDRSLVQWVARDAEGEPILKTDLPFEMHGYTDKPLCRTFVGLLEHLGIWDK